MGWGRGDGMRDRMGEGRGDERRTREGNGMGNEGGTKTTRTDGETSNALVTYSEFQRATSAVAAFGRGLPFTSTGYEGG